MTPLAQSFSESLQRSADEHERQMWRAALTVRANVAAADGLDSMLECLGLADAQRPSGT